MSVLAPTSSAEPPQTLAARNFRPGNRPRHRRHLLCCRQSIPRTHGAASRRRTGTGLGPTTATPPHRSIQLLRGIQLFAASSFGPRRQHRSIRLSAGVQLFRGAQLCTAPHVDNRTSLIPGKSLESPISRKSEHPSVISDFPANRSIPSFSSKSAIITEIGLHGQSGQNHRIQLYRQIGRHHPNRALPPNRPNRQNGRFPLTAFGSFPRSPWIGGTPQSHRQYRQLSLDKLRLNQVKRG